MAFSISKIIKTEIVEPTKKHLTLVFFVGGLLMVFIGALFDDQIDAFIAKGTAEALLKTGSAILGAGVFAVIMKSAQFTKLFQEHIFDVIYRPERIFKKEALIAKWETITNSLLKQVLPKTHMDATEKIERQYVDIKMEYHFQRYFNTYTITIDNDKKIATIHLRSRSTIVLSPYFADPILSQIYFVEENSDENDEHFKLKSLRLNDIDLASDYNYKRNDPTNKEKELRIPLAKYAEEREDGVKTVFFEKVMEWKQNLTNDPFLKVEISRYIKGLTVRYKISDGYKIIFRKFGLGKMPVDARTPDDGEGYERWTIANQNTLLLPGQGFILVLTPDLNGQEKRE